MAIERTRIVLELIDINPNSTYFEELTPIRFREGPKGDQLFLAFHPFSPYFSQKFHPNDDWDHRIRWLFDFVRSLRWSSRIGKSNSSTKECILHNNSHSRNERQAVSHRPVTDRPRHRMECTNEPVCPWPTGNIPRRSYEPRESSTMGRGPFSSFFYQLSTLPSAQRPHFSTFSHQKHDFFDQFWPKFRPFSGRFYP